MGRRALIIGLPAVALLGLIGWRLLAKSTEAAQLQQGQDQRKKAPVSAVIAVAGPKQLVQILEVAGSFESPFEVKLSPKVVGRINNLEVREGATVTAGEALIRIDPTEVEGLVLQQQAAVAEARSRLAQAQLAQEPTNVGIASSIEQQRATLASTQADFNQASENYAAQVAAAQSAVTDADAKVNAAQSSIGSAEADLSSAKSNRDNAKARNDRAQALLEKGYVSQQDAETAKTAFDVAQSGVLVAQAKLTSAKSSLESARAVRSSAANQAEIVKRKGKADIEAAKARVTRAQAGLKVANANRSQGPAYKENLAALKSIVDSAVAQLNQAISKRADTTIRSPINGTVTDRQMNPGMIASPGQPILTIDFLDWLYVTCNVPAEQSGAIKKGLQVSIVVDALPGKSFEGVVSDVNAAADPQSRQVSVQIRVENPNHELMPGTYARVTFPISKVDAKIAVPREAVRSDPKQGTVVTIVDSSGLAKTAQVKTGASDSQSLEILEGLSPGDRVVSLTYQPIKDGQKVTEGGAGKGNSKKGKGQ